LRAPAWFQPTHSAPANIISRRSRGTCGAPQAAAAPRRTCACTAPPTAKNPPLRLHQGWTEQTPASCSAGRALFGHRFERERGQGGHLSLDEARRGQEARADGPRRCVAVHVAAASPACPPGGPAAISVSYPTPADAAQGHTKSSKHAGVLRSRWHCAASTEDHRWQPYGAPNVQVSV